MSHAGKFFTSIAVQLADWSPSLRHHICAAIAANTSISAQSLRDQWDQLILQPLSKIDGNCVGPSLMIVVDALDECDNDNDIRTILQLFTEAASLDAVRLRFFMTSRPEIPIRYGFGQMSESEHRAFVLHNIYPSVVDHDISLLLQYQFGLIQKEYSLQKDWPGDQNMKHLIQRAAGLFIWAATAFRFVREGRRFAPRRLSLLLEGNAPMGGGPEKHLNDMYLTVLENSICQEYAPEEREELSRVLRETVGSVVILFSPLSVISLSTLLQISQDEIALALYDLHSILSIPEDHAEPIRLHHPSFRDFILDRTRCTNLLFLVDERKMHERVAVSSLRLMSEKLGKNMCKLPSPGTRITEVQPDVVAQRLSSELQYACLYWARHVQKSEMCLKDDGPVHLFLKRHLLHWLEALSLLRKTSEAVLAILSLGSAISVSGSFLNVCHGTLT